MEHFPMADIIADDRHDGPTYTLAPPKPPVAAAPPQPEGDALVPEGFLRLSDAANILEDKMWGGLPLPIPVKHIKEELGQKLSVGWERWRKRARQRLRQAATESELSVFVITVAGAEPVPVPATVLKLLITSRGRLSDHPVPLPSLSVVRKGGGDERLYALMKTGILIVNRKEFEAWCRLESRKRKWPSQRSPSQRSRSKRPEGRPSKRTDDDLRHSVWACVNDKRWNGRMGIPSLRRLLASEGREISEDTLSRLIEDLFDESGHPDLRVAQRRKRRRLPQN
jgi:hypothetical protein